MKQHLPYNVLLIATVITIGLMAVFNLAMRQSDFAVRVGYAIPPPPVAEAPAAPSPPTMPEEPEPAPDVEQPYQYQLLAEVQPYIEQEPVVLVRFPLELNAATYEQLQFIRGIGPVTARSIIQHREQLGGYTHISQLLDVRGIGPATFYRITAYLYLANQVTWEQEADEYMYDEYDYYYDQAQYYD